MERRRPTANAKASRALSLIRKFKNEEDRKYCHDNDETMQIPAGGNWIVEGFGPYMIQGNTSTTRIGNKITVEKLTMKWQIKLTALEAISGAVRLVILMDRRPDGANCTSADVMQSDNEINATYDVAEARRGRFQILVDKIYTFDSAQGMRLGKMFLRRDIKILYTGNAGTVADVQRNNFVIMAMSDPGTAAINVDYSYKFTFTDA